MGFRQRDNEGRGGFARIWSIENKGNYSVAKISTSKKNKDGGYETDFQDGYVRLVGSAHEKAQNLNVTENGVTIQIASCDVTTSYNQETKKSYVNYVIFAFVVPDEDSNNNSSIKTKSKTEPKSSRAKSKKEEVVEDELDDDLPF